MKYVYVLLFMLGIVSSAYGQILSIQYQQDCGEVADSALIQEIRDSILPNIKYFHTLRGLREWINMESLNALCSTSVFDQVCCMQSIVFDPKMFPDARQADAAPIHIGVLHFSDTSALHLAIRVMLPVVQNVVRREWDIYNYYHLAYSSFYINSIDGKLILVHSDLPLNGREVITITSKIERIFLNDLIRK